ncbi:hypothetical protein BD410DRAFT_297164 [Rickenella mellea]|uniref:J domain-containing protein n=1 Tax=Rickenella mellea TaxID=50990 RepID=A0A4Y7Q445_9AGAM|nr:hypothetical protein BD410DRAFT_297164 [Rickenella mellea]
MLESRIPPISQNREVQSTEREWVQAAEEWVPEIQVKYETSLQQREEGLKDREALLTKREHDSKYEDDQRRHRESLFFARIVEASKRQSSWVSREESVRRHEMDLLEREDGLNSRHKGLLKREQELVKREEELMRRQQSLAQREAEIMRREDEFQQREGADLSEEGIKRAEEAVLRLQEQLASKTKEEKAKQMDISRKEQEIIIRENEVSRREIEVSRREGEQSKETGQSKASTISSYDDSFVRPKNSEGNLLSPSDIPRSRSANSSTSASQSNVGWDPTSQPFSPSGHMRSASVASRAGGRWLSGNSTGTEPDVPESTPRQAASQRSSTASSWSSARSTAASSWSSSRTSHPSRPASRASTASVNATRSSRSNSAEDRKTLQEELAKKQQEQFHVETQKSEMERLASAATSMNKDRVAKAWENYGAWWSTIAEQEILRFHTISWPTIAAAKSVDDLNMSAIGVFVLSPHHSYGKSAKDRIKEQLLRWHPDRFESKWLQKVPEGEKEVVKDGVGQVARVLSELLNRESYIHISS